MLVYDSGDNDSAFSIDDGDFIVTPTAVRLVLPDGNDAVLGDQQRTCRWIGIVHGDDTCVNDSYVVGINVLRCKKEERRYREPPLP